MYPRGKGLTGLLPDNCRAPERESLQQQTFDRLKRSLMVYRRPITLALSLDLNEELFAHSGNRGLSKIKAGVPQSYFPRQDFSFTKHE